MEEIKANPILKFNKNQLEEVRKVHSYDDVEKLKQDLKHFQEWIQKQSHYRVKEFDNDFLERLLIYNKGSIERTKQKFDRFCTCINLMPDFLQNYDIKNEFRATFKMANLFLLPKPTDENYRILYTHATGDDDKDFEVLSFYRYLVVIGQYLMCHDYCHGYVWLADLRFVTFALVAKINPIVIHKGLQLMVEAMGHRIKNFHFLSGSKFFEAMLTLLKQGMTAKLRSRVVVHSTIESLYEHIPREHLPKDLGGDEPSISEIKETTFKELSSDAHIERIKFMESLATDESKRLAYKFNEDYSGMPGSFKTLCVD